AEDVFEELLSLIVAGNHAWAKRGCVSMKEAAELPFATLLSSFITRRMIDLCFEKAGVQPRVALATTSIPSILAAVRMGRLATIQAAHFLPLDGLALVQLINPTPSRRAGLLWVRNRHRSAAARALADILRAEIARRVALEDRPHQPARRRNTNSAHKAKAHGKRSLD